MKGLTWDGQGLVRRGRPRKVALDALWSTYPILDENTGVETDSLRPRQYLKTSNQALESAWRDSAKTAVTKWEW